MPSINRDRQPLEQGQTEEKADGEIDSNDRVRVLEVALSPSI